ncbi:hypothetical protein L210DRAFT_3590441 [Boletus edulis BED1]|uniref:Uncharacterized protein n=1 Tax=Boletus edulis BED1 TaxID=1328754 RepID=A0AAD4B9S5_BOLED|nr:hypothetical protein L210DRAFT_3590441 [Boletus edulis BED1]
MSRRQAAMETFQSHLRRRPFSTNRRRHRSHGSTVGGEMVEGRSGRSRHAAWRCIHRLLAHKRVVR